MGLLDWFTRKSQQKLRLSQIKILYQNRLAIEYLRETFIVAQSAGLESGSDLLIGLNDFELYVDDAILELSWNTILSDEQSLQLAQINGALRNLYSGVMEGKRRARAASGGDATGIEKFENRFAPAVGWSKFSDTEWDSFFRKTTARMD